MEKLSTENSAPIGSTQILVSSSYRLGVVSRIRTKSTALRNRALPAVNATAQPESLIRAFASLNLVAAGVGAFVALVHGAVADACRLSRSEAVCDRYSLLASRLSNMMSCSRKFKLVSIAHASKLSHV